MQQQKVSLVFYVDDVNRSKRHIEKKFSMLDSGYFKVGIELISEKFVVLLFNWGNSGPTPSFQLECSLGKPVKQFVYLGLLIRSPSSIPGCS
jgi:hypothetical protein